MLIEHSPKLNEVMTASGRMSTLVDTRYRPRASLCRNNRVQRGSHSATFVSFLQASNTFLEAPSQFFHYFLRQRFR